MRNYDFPPSDFDYERQALCEIFTQHAQPIYRKFIVQAPMVLQVANRIDGILSTYAFIGGEKLTCASAKLGKNNRINFTFKPITPQHYSHVVVSETIVETIMGVEFSNFLKEILSTKTLDGSSTVFDRAKIEKKRTIELGKPLDRMTLINNPQHGTW